MLPVAPGVVAGQYEAKRYQFLNLSVGQVKAHLEQFVEQVLTVTPEVEIILTVSPVPLVATYESRHVLVSTTLSKSVLRAAADEIERKFDRVIYFPSYEIITSSANGGRYFDDDLRQVNELGVSHVMRLFRKHFLDNAASPRATGVSFIPEAADVVCDEETIAQSLHSAGLSLSRP